MRKSDFNKHYSMLVISCRKEYKDRKAAANMPPKPQKPIWQPKRKHKKKKRIDDW